MGDSFIPAIWLDEVERHVMMDGLDGWLPPDEVARRRERRRIAGLELERWRLDHPWLARRRDIAAAIRRRRLAWRNARREARIRIGYAIRALAGDWPAPDDDY